MVGCSRKKDKFLNKKFHSITTTYNYLFNGNNLFSSGQNELETGEKENFWGLIPIEKFKYLMMILKKKERLILQGRGKGYCNSKAFHEC